MCAKTFPLLSWTWIVPPSIRCDLVIWLEQLRQDLRYGLRSLGKTPPFTAAAALTIALGVGANTTVFSLMDAVLLRSRPVEQPAELVFLETAGAFGLLAIVLAAIGLYGMLSYRVGRQRLSIGIRMALGASPSGVAMDVMSKTVRVVAFGLLAGLPFAVIAARMAENLLWEVKASDPVTYVAAASMLGLVGLASAYAPARRAAKVDPAETLRLG